MPSLAHRRVGLTVLASLLSAAVVGAGFGQAASSSVVVSMSVTSATSLDITACAAGTPDLAFGAVLPGTSAVTTADCDISFGSSNDTAGLRLSQVDGRGPAMMHPFDGPLDTTFGTGGTWSIDPSAGNDVFWDAVEMPDGDIVLSGHYEAAAGDGGMLLARLAPDGTPRAGFGVNGVVTMNDLVGDQMAWTIAPRSDNSILVGAARAGSVAVGRFLPDGSQDMTWGGDGWRELPLSQTPRVMRIGLDGSIYMAGTAYWPTTDCVVTRLLSNGTIDTTYGTGGSVRVGPNPSYCDGFDLDRQGRGIIASTTGGDAVLARVTTAGSLDTTYGGGVRTFDPEGAATAYYDVMVLPDGSSLQVGISDGAMVLSRYDSAGAPLAGFGGGDGHLRLPAYGFAGRDVAWIDGRITIVGDYGNSRIVRLNADGTPDTSFSDDGFLDPTVPGSTEDNGLLVLGDGRAMVFGKDGTSAQVAMLRASSIPDHAGGSADWNDGTGFFGACLRGIGATGSATWTANASCSANDGAWWNDVATSPETIATSNSGQSATVASLRFGVRVPTSQPPGAYVAPIRVEVLAPAA